MHTEITQVSDIIKWKSSGLLLCTNTGMVHLPYAHTEIQKSGETNEGANERKRGSAKAIRNLEM